MLLSSYERMIALRYLLPGKGERFIVVVAGFSLGAVMLGVAALIIVMSVMNGFRAELFEKIVDLNGHAVVKGTRGGLDDWRDWVRQARAIPGVTSAIPMVEKPLMSSYNGRVEGVLVHGMQVADLRANKTIAGKVVAGSLEGIVPGASRIAIGTGLAESLGAQVGSEITVVDLAGVVVTSDTMPRYISYTVAAIFETGVYDYDKTYVVMPMQDAQTLLRAGDKVSFIEIQTSDAERVGQILAPLKAKVGQRAVILDWRQMNTQLFQALAVERVAMFTVLCIIILVATFNIASSLIMLVRAKSRDIAVLRTMGATPGAILRIFMTVGTTIGILGIFAGTLLGALFLFYRQPIVDFLSFMFGQNRLSPSIRSLMELPSKPDPIEIAAIILITLLMTFLATLYPSFKAANTDPVQVLRYN